MSRKVILKHKIGLDVDGVLRNFDKKAIEIFQRVYPDKMNMESIDSYGYDFSGLMNDIPRKELAKIWQETHCDEIYRDAELMPGVKEELNILRNWCRKQKDVRYSFAVATAQIPYNSNHTLYWLGLHRFNILEYHVTNFKHKLDLEYLIDDSPKNYAAWVKYGKPEANYFLFDGPNNRGVECTNRIFKLSDAIEILQKN